MKFNKLIILLLMSIGLIVTSTQTALADKTTTKSTYDWTGVYVGGFVGGASSASTNTSEPYSNEFNAYWNPTNNSYNYDTNASFIGGELLAITGKQAKPHTQQDQKVNMATQT